MSLAEILLEAADKVQFGGWTQHTYAEDAAGNWAASGSPNAVKWCLRGAVKAVAGNDYRAFRACDAVYLYLTERGWRQGVMSWNDQPNRTAGEVADTLRRVAKELSNAGRLQEAS